MKIWNILNINLNKLKLRKVKALFLILPVTVLMTLTIIVSSQVKNFEDASNQSIFGTIDNQATLINLTKTVDFTQNNQTRGQGQQNLFDSNNQFTSDDIAKIKSIANVTSASINSQVPVSNAQTTDLFSGSNYKINNIVELDANSASLYTQDDFSYTDGQTIPIILNANTFVEQTEDWQGKDSIDVTFTRGSRPGASTSTSTTATPMPTTVTRGPITTKTITYDKNSLLGKTFTVSFGGLAAQNDYKVTQSAGTQTYTKLAQADIDANLATEKAAIAKYWDYDKLNTPLTYTFKVVGVIESQSDNKTYIPQDFADSLVNKYVQNQLDARNATAIPTTDLNSTYRGMTYDGTQLTSGVATRGGFGNFGGGQGGFGGNRTGNATTTASTESYTIPGLVVELSNDGNQTVQGVYADANVYKNSVKTGQTVSVKINTIYNRGQVVADLNSAGFAYQDINNLDVFTNLRNTLSNISLGLTVVFIIFAIAVIIFAMSKFVSESRKEIGIFRAIGVKKSDIVKLFTSQAMLYSLIGLVIGAGLGILINIVISPLIYNWFQDLVGNTIKQTYNVVNSIDGSLFTHIAWTTVGIYAIVLVVITLLISLIPSLRASSISPVEAITGE